MVRRIHPLQKEVWDANEEKTTNRIYTFYMTVAISEKSE